MLWRSLCFVQIAVSLPVRCWLRVHPGPAGGEGKEDLPSIQSTLGRGATARAESQQRAQFVVTDRLWNVGIESGVEGLPALLRSDVAGQRDQEDLILAQEAAEPLGNGVSVQ